MSKGYSERILAPHDKMLKSLPLGKKMGMCQVERAI